MLNVKCSLQTETPSHLSRCRPIFSSLLMASVGVLALEHIFIDARRKINGQYYLMHKLLPNIREFWFFYFTFQQDSAPAHRAQKTVDLAWHQTYPPSLWPTDSPDLNPVDYLICSVLQQRFIARKSKMWTSVTSYRWVMGTPGPVYDRKCSQTVALTYSLLWLHGCKGQTFR